MSVTPTQLAVVVADQDEHTNGSETIADVLIQGDPVAVEELIADVLRRAHRMAESANAPDEARAIFHVAQAFAEELAGVDPQFDRMRFIRTATDRLA